MKQQKNAGRKEKTDSRFVFVPYEAERADGRTDTGYSYWGSVLYQFCRNRLTLVFLGVFVLLVLLSLICPEAGRYTIHTLVIDPDLAFTRPCGEFWFGTDNLGQDYWCQVWYASRVSITLAILVSLGEILLGVAFGLLWGYVDKLNGLFTFIYNLIDNIPTIIYLTLVALFIGQGFRIMALSLIAIGWLPMAREVRNMTMMLRDREFNLASRCLGTPAYRVLMKNILPHLVSVIILQVALSIPATIAMESTLSFLGLGLDINTPSLGILLKNARAYFLEYGYLLFFSAVIVSMVTLTFYLAGNAFADASDPRNHR